MRTRSKGNETKLVSSRTACCWRRERDSNPRSPLGLSGFQDRLFQPLTHPSAGRPIGLYLQSTSCFYQTRQLLAGTIGVPFLQLNALANPG